MYSWLGFTQDKLNDVVLTPSYVATLLAKLARVDKDSYVWDFATGSRVIIMTVANSTVKSRVLKLLPKLKTRKIKNLCTV